MPRRKQISNQGASGAFSTNTDEDWTQISDLAERRRIQNRIAQRTYRKNLKRRLEDPERRAGSSSASPVEVHTQQPTRNQQTSKAHSTLSISTVSCPELSPKGLARNQYTPLMHNDEDPLSSTDFGRDGSHAPPLFVYPSPKESICLPYPTTQSYPAPMSLHLMTHPSEASKRNSSTSNDDSLNLFSMSYATMAGMDIQASQTYRDFNPQTLPLSHSFELNYLL